MSETSNTGNLFKKIATNRSNRRRFMGQAGLAGLAALGASHLSTAPTAAQTVANDRDILNFSLHLEYLEAEFYLRAALGRGLVDADTTGTGTLGPVTGGSQVPFASETIRQYALEIAADEEAHVKYIRATLAALGLTANARPAINIGTAFADAAVAAGLPGTFNPYADENSFLLGAFIFEDVGVTAYKGAARLITNRDVLEGAAGLLAVEAYHASQIRTVLFGRGLRAPVLQISNARDSLDGATDLDQGITDPTTRLANIVPTDANGLAFSRTPRQVLNIVFLNPDSTVQSGGFFPSGINLAF